ncbi:MAG: DUF86 domain-containing protein [Bacteroidales bacterium]|nr:DUF86 domain-containing protein [Bacteroidales bacterium]MCF8457099.1 DUF86 domain-containing protein [Bacteroidales bacterium]
MIEKERLIIDYLNDILRSPRNIKDFVGNLDFHEFEQDIKSQYAVIRALEIIGESSKKIPNEIKEDYPKIPWRYWLE